MYINVYISIIRNGKKKSKNNLNAHQHESDKTDYIKTHLIQYYITIKNEWIMKTHTNVYES